MEFEQAVESDWQRGEHARNPFLKLFWQVWSHMAELETRVVELEAKTAREGQ